GEQSTAGGPGQHRYGTLYTCAVGPKSLPLRKDNGLEGFLQTIALVVHQVTKLQEEYVRTKLADQGRVYHSHPTSLFSGCCSTSRPSWSSRLSTMLTS